MAQTTCFYAIAISFLFTWCTSAHHNPPQTSFCTICNVSRFTNNMSHRTFQFVLAIISILVFAFPCLFASVSVARCPLLSLLPYPCLSNFLSVCILYDKFARLSASFPSFTPTHAIFHSSLSPLSPSLSVSRSTSSIASSFPLSFCFSFYASSISFFLCRRKSLFGSVTPFDPEK